MVINSGSINAKQRRQRALLELVTGTPIGSQEELVERLRVAGYEVTQATVSRDAAELGLVKVPRGDRHVYARLRRLLEDIPVRIARSGLTLVLLATPGTAGAIAQAIDQSSLQDQVGTLAGDNTLLVLFDGEAALERWLVRFHMYQPAGAAAPPTVRPFGHSEAPR